MLPIVVAFLIVIPTLLIIFDFVPVNHCF
jgi:hypothetical protein